MGTKRKDPNRPLPRIGKYSGRIRDKVYSVRNGKQCVRALGDMNEARVKSDPAFTDSLAAGREFGAACKVSKVIRDGIGPGCFALGGQFLHSRMTAVLRKHIHAVDGQRGIGPIRAISILQGLSQFRIKKHRGGFQVGDLGMSRINPPLLAGAAPVWSFRGIGTPYLKDMPKWVGFVRFSVIAVAVSDMVLNDAGDGYISKRPEIHGLRQVRFSPLLKLSEVAGFSWDVNLNSLFEGISMAEAGMVVTVGVECFEDNLQVATQEASVPFGSLLPGWDSGWIPEGEQSLSRFMGKKRKEAGLRFRALEIVYAGGVLRTLEANCESVMKGISGQVRLSVRDRVILIGSLIGGSFVRANDRISWSIAHSPGRTFSHDTPEISGDCRDVGHGAFLCAGRIKAPEAGSS